MEALEIKDRDATYIKIPDTVTSLDEWAFSDWANIENIECSNAYYKSIDGVLFTADYKTLVCYPRKRKGISYIVPDSVANIENHAFADCKSLENIILPNSLISIGEDAFFNCEYLQDIVLPNSLVSIGCRAFMYCGYLRNIELPNSITSIGEKAFADCYFLESIVLPTSLTDIANGLFGSCRNLQNVILSDSITRIGETAFRDCELLQSITLPDSITSIERYAFANCMSLRSIVLPNSLMIMGDAVFASCKHLRNIQCDSQYCKSIDGVLFTADYKTLIYYPMEKGQRNYAIPVTTEIIGQSAFRDCCLSNNIKIPDSVRAIKDSAFRGSYFSSIELSNSVEEIESGALNCPFLKNIECDSEYYKSIDGALFTSDYLTLVCYPGGREEKSYIVPESVSSITKDAFRSSGSLRSVTLPDSTTIIEDDAFCYCSLDKIIVPKGFVDKFEQILPKGMWGKLKEQ